MSRKLIRITDTDRLRQEGIHFPTVGATRWFAARAADNKFRDAVVRIGRRVFIDPDRYHQIARGESASTAPSPQQTYDDQDAPIFKAARLAARSDMRLWREGKSGSVRAAQIGRMDRVLLEFPDWTDAIEYFEALSMPKGRARRQEAASST